MYNLEQRKNIDLDPTLVEKETFENLLSMCGFDLVAARIAQVDFTEEIEELKLLAKQLTLNTIRNDK